MATDYASLKTQVATWLSRSDLTSVIPDWIAEGLQRINKELAINGGIRDQETAGTSTTVASQEYVDLPTGFRRFEFIKIGTTTLESSTYGRLIDIYGDSTGQPLEYAIVGSKLYLRPIPNDVYTLTYVYTKDYPALSADGDTNILITDGNNVLLYAALMEAEGVIQNDPRIQLWASHYKEAMRVLIDTERRARRDAKPSGLRMEWALLQPANVWSITTDN